MVQDELQKDNFIDLKIGDEFRFNRSRKDHKVINMFEDHVQMKMVM